MSAFEPVACPFCRPTIVPASFAESAHFRAVVNRSPILPGHALIMPKRHVQSLLSLRPDELVEFTFFSRHITERLLHIYGANAFNWAIQEHESAGQTVAHLHLHIFPRHTHDLPRPGDWYPQMLQSYIMGEADSNLRPQLSLDEQARLADWLRHQL